MKSLRTAWKHIRRSPYQAIAAILTMFLTFLVVGVFFLASAASITVLTYFEKKPQITVFFKDDASERDILQVKKQLEETGKTSSVTYVSKQDALTLYREQNKDDPLLLEMVTADILPGSLEISPVDPVYLSQLEPLIRQERNVEEVVYQKDMIETLLRWTYAIRIIGLTLGILLALDALLVTSIIIGMKIALRREEVEVLRLIGASRWYIRLPFVLEGAVYGLVGAAFSFGVITGALLYMRPFLLAFLGTIPSINVLLIDPWSVVFLTSSVGFFALLTGTGFLLGTIGSLVAVGRYLKI